MSFSLCVGQAGRCFNLSPCWSVFSMGTLVGTVSVMEMHIVLCITHSLISSYAFCAEIFKLTTCSVLYGLRESEKQKHDVMSAFHEMA